MLAPIAEHWGDLAEQGGLFLLVWARTLALAWLAPAWGTPGLGVRVRVLFSALLAAIVVPLLGANLSEPLPTDAATLARWCLAEAVMGAGLGLAAALILAAARQAGEIVGLQAGLSPAALLDPEAGAGGLTPLGHLYGLLALATFLAIDGPLLLVGVLVKSYQIMPLGEWVLTSQTVTLAFGRVALALELALRLAAPIAIALVAANLAFGLLIRTIPALQAFTLSLPIRVALGLLFVFVGLSILVATLVQGWGGFVTG